MRYIFCTFLFLLSSTAHAQIQRTYQARHLTIEPVVGYERVQKVEPTRRSSSRFYYGVRANYGPPLFSLEAEVTQAREDESFNEQDLRIKETATTGMLGLRSSFGHQNILSWHLRAGGHARKRDIERTQDGETTDISPSINISPYAGTGMSFNLSNMVRLNAGITVIFTGEPRGSDREYQTSLGFSVNI